MAPPLARLRQSNLDAAKGITDGSEQATKRLEFLGKGALAVSVGFTALNAIVKSYGGTIFQNQKAFEDSASSAAGIAAYSDAAGQALTSFGTNAEKYGDTLQKAFPGKKLGKFGGMLSKVGPKIASFGANIAKAGNVLAYLELAGGILEGLFTTDYRKVTNELEKVGNESGAAAAAAKAYAQEQNRSIPIIGRFINVFGNVSDITADELDARGKMVVETSALRASMVSLKRAQEKASKSFDQSLKEAFKSGDFVQAASELTSGSAFFSASDAMFERGAAQISRGIEQGSVDAMSLIVKRIDEGAIVGMGVGALAGPLAPVTATTGAIAGGVLGGVSGFF